MAQPALNQFDLDHPAQARRDPIRKRLLLIVDDELYRQRLSRDAADAGFNVRVAATAAEAVVTFRADWTPDAVVLDQLMPRGERYASIRALRSAFAVPILVVSSEPLAGDASLERGVLLLSRQAVLTEIRHLDAFDDQSPSILSLGPLLLDRRTGVARLHRRELNLTPDEATTLGALMLHPGEIVTRGSLLAAIGGLQRDLDARIVDVHVIRLMVKLGAASPLTIERSTDREGYAIRLTVRTLTEPSPVFP